MSEESEEPVKAPVGDSGQDAGGKAHTGLDEEHPAGSGPRTDREVGGPVAEEDAAETDGGAKGTRPTPGFEPHQ